MFISSNFERFISKRPDGWAIIKGSVDHPNIEGNVRFFQSDYGTLVVTEVKGLPKGSSPCKSPIFAYHIHEKGNCQGNSDDPFAEVGVHYNPHGCPHPYHAGDMPPLLGADGYAFSAFLTNRFTVKEIIGRAVIIHASPDDFTTQPSGNAGKKIACGEIMEA